MISPRTLLRVTIVALIALSGSLSLTTSAHAQGKWERKAAFPDPSEEVLGMAAGGKMYVFAGLAPVWKPKALVYEYDPASNKWTERKKMALPSHHVAFAEYQGRNLWIWRLRAAGVGAARLGPDRQFLGIRPGDRHLEGAGPDADQARRRGRRRHRRQDHVVGGAATPSGTDEPSVLPTRPHLSVGTLEEYDIATNTWRTRRPMPTARNHLMAGAVDGKLYAIGGRLGAAFIGLASDTDVVEEYNPADDLWRIKARMPTARSAIAGGVHGGRIYVAGGEMQDTQKSATFRAFEGYDPATNAWAVLPGMPVSRHGMAAGVTGDQLHLVSGDVQSAGSGLEVSAPYHDVFTFGK